VETGGHVPPGRGEFVTLKDVVNESGRDAATVYLFGQRHYESPLDFDLELAKQRPTIIRPITCSTLHARISSIIRKGRRAGC